MSVLLAIKTLYTSAENLNYDIKTNGEKKLINFLKDTFFIKTKNEKILFFDVGCNIGDWTKEALDVNQSLDLHIHCFEPTPSTFKQLQENTKKHETVTLNNIALSDKTGEAQITWNNDCDVLAKLDKEPSTADSKKTNASKVALSSGDDYIKTAKIKHIHFLKIDTEGHDLSVMKGFSTTLKAGAIDVIQFEYGRANILNGESLHVINSFLEKHGYTIAKIYPNDLFFGYDSWNWEENYIGPNFVAFSNACIKTLETKALIKNHKNRKYINLK